MKKHVCRLCFRYIYESTLMRRLSGLLYVDDKEAGDIKRSVIENKTTENVE